MLPIHLIDEAENMTLDELLAEARRQFAAADVLRATLISPIYERGGWFLLLVHAARTDGVEGRT